MLLSSVCWPASGWQLTIPHNVFLCCWFFYIGSLYSCSNLVRCCVSVCWQYKKKEEVFTNIYDRTLVNNFCGGVRNLRPVLLPILAVPSPWSLPVFPDNVRGVVVDLEVDWPLVLFRPRSCGVVVTLADDVNGVLRTAAPWAPGAVSAGPPTLTKNDIGRATPAASVGLLGSVVARHTPLSPFSSTIPNPSVVGWRHCLLPTTNDDDVTSSVRVQIQVPK